MNITDTDSQGNSITWKLPLERGKEKVLASLATTDDEPIVIYYFESGWTYRYPTFHVIIEYGAEDRTDYKFLSLDEMVKLFGVSPEEITAKQSVLITKENFFKEPNDQELGRAARKSFINQNMYI